MEPVRPTVSSPHAGLVCQNQRHYTGHQPAYHRIGGEADEAHKLRRFFVEVRIGGYTTTLPVLTSCCFSNRTLFGMRWGLIGSSV